MHRTLHGLSNVCRAIASATLSYVGAAEPVTYLRELPEAARALQAVSVDHCRRLKALKLDFGRGFQTEVTADGR